MPVREGSLPDYGESVWGPSFLLGTEFVSCNRASPGTGSELRVPFIQSRRLCPQALAVGVHCRVPCRTWLRLLQRCQGDGGTGDALRLRLLLSLILSIVLEPLPLFLFYPVFIVQCSSKKGNNVVFNL